jgi:O-antigen ligase
LTGGEAATLPIGQNDASITAKHSLMPLLPYHLSLLFLLLAITLPFLGAHHYQPIATFHQEWLAGTLGLVALLPLAFANDERPWLLPRTALLPLAMVVLAWLQFATNSAVLYESTVLLSLYLVWAFLLMLALCRIETGLGRDALGNALAWALLGGAMLLAATGALQHWAPWIGMPYIFPADGAMKGNIAQSNNFADYLWIGVACALYLHGRSRLAAAPLWLLLPVLVGLSLMSGSRSVYFFAFALTGWLLVWAWTLEGKARRPLLRNAFLLLPLLLAVQWLIDSSGASISSAQRLVAQGSYDPVRMTLWRAALDIFADHPLLGAGFDSYSREYFARIAHFPINGAGIPEHSHNLLTELLAEFGLAGFALVVGTAVVWLTALRKQRNDATIFLVTGILLILGIHSGLEYPLWYANFLAIAVFMLALGDSRRTPLVFAGRHRLVLAGLAMVGLLTLLSLRSDYITLEAAAQGQSTDGKLIPVATQQAWLVEIYTQSLWRNQAALQFAARMPIEAEDTGNRLQIMREALHYSPIRQAAFSYAALLQLDGQHDAAREQLKRAMLSYPSDIPMVERQLEAAAADAPALKPLIALLRQRNF